jgi:sterol desaturase/sphingolipid hydroxylase (fatty acid hydroxylase superfamily)
MSLSIQILLAPIAVVAMAERVPSLWRRRSRLFRPHALTDITFFVVAWLAIAQLTLTWVQWATAQVHGGAGVSAAAGLPLWLEVVVAIVLLDLGNYLAHWLLHRVAALWHFHAVHHSVQVLDWLATFRSHLVEQLVRRVVAPLLLIVIGFSTPAVLLASAVFLAWAVVNHANLRIDLRALESIFITPRLHHLHHVARSSENNLGTVFSIWDRVLGRLSVADVPRDIALGNGLDHYPQTFAALLREPFRQLTKR